VDSILGLLGSFGDIKGIFGRSGSSVQCSWGLLQFSVRGYIGVHFVRFGISRAFL